MTGHINLNYDFPHTGLRCNLINKLIIMFVASKDLSESNNVNVIGLRLYNIQWYNYKPKNIVS